jgi:pimeloyl-ACP methyl ester carboxylesterase
MNSGRRLGTVQPIDLPDGRSLCVRHWRSRGGTTLVFLHGLLDSSEGWTSLCEALPGTRIAFDLPGFGSSDPPPRGSLRAYASDIARGLDAIGSDRLTVVGHSLGGAVAVALAEQMPERIDALVLLAPAGFGHIHLADAISMPGVRHLAAAALPFLLSSSLAIRSTYMALVSNGVTPDAELVERVTIRGGTLVDGALEGTRALVEASHSEDAFHRRRLRYRGPVYAVWGDRDRVVSPGHACGLRTGFPQALIEIWPGVGHHPTAERFQSVVSLVGRATRPSRSKLTTVARAAAA